MNFILKMLGEKIVLVEIVNKNDETLLNVINRARKNGYHEVDYESHNTKYQVYKRETK